MPLVPTDIFEREAWVRGFRRVAGLDEAGCGPLAGPVVAAAVVVPRGFSLEGLRDSKLLTPRQRERLYVRILLQAVEIAIGVVDAATIDALNIREASRVAMERAIAQLALLPDYLILDGMGLPRLTVEQRVVIKGDGLSLAVAAASVIAKVTRDCLMAEAHLRHPEYGFLAHKGYGTAEHLSRLRRYGPCVLHRRSYRPVQQAVRQS